MTWIALILVLCSAPIHAGWNLLARRARSEGAFFSGLLKWGAILGFGPVVVSVIVSGPMPGTAWLCVLFSGCCCGAYLFFLAKGYSGSIGDTSSRALAASDQFAVLLCWRARL